jgi:hypothetical protein
MRYRIPRLALPAILFGCSGPPSDYELPPSEDTQAPSSDLAAGTATFLLPIEGSGEDTVAVRLHWPASDRTRYPGVAPVVIHVEGGWHSGELSEEEAWTLAEVHGYIHLSFLLPGGTAADGSFTSSGERDTRGEQSLTALSAVLDYASGQQADSQSLTLLDRIPFADTEHVGMLGESNGANLILNTLASRSTPSASLRWVSFWESPVGDQFATTEIDNNDFYIPGSCGLQSCPLTGIESQLRFDAHGKTQVIVEGSPQHLDGVFFLDADADNHPDPDERRFSGIPYLSAAGLHVIPSMELRQTLTTHSETVFNESTEPNWLPSHEDVQDFWALRDGSLHISAVRDQYPQLLVMVTQRRTDHVLSLEDNPHTISHLKLWEASGTGFFRLNPDAVYLSQVTGIDPAFLTDNPANAVPTFPNSLAWMVPNEIDGLSMTTAVTVGSILELADRAHFERLDPNLNLPITSSQ